MTVKVWAIGVFSSVLAVYGAGAFYEGYLAKGYAGAMTFPFVDRAAAERANDTLPAQAPLAAREAAAARLLKANPASAQSWALVSYMDWLGHDHHLTAAGLSALDRSYTMSPYDHDIAPWRASFTLENWDTLTPALRQLEVSELNWMFEHDLTVGLELKARLKTVKNPVGRAFANLESVLAPPG